MLEQERHFFDEQLAEWLCRYPNKVALVHGNELIGMFDTETDALAEGARRFGLGPYLVRRVLPEQEKISVPALTLGILNADSSPPV